MIKQAVEKNKIGNYHPKSKYELYELIRQSLKKRGKDADLNDIDVSNITEFNLLFLGLDPHNIKIDQWDVRNAKDMSGMFHECENLNCDLSKWDVSNVEYMGRMFDGCENFTGKGLENWNVSKVKDMYQMFKKCKKFDCDLSNWDVSNVEDMDHMFEYCTSLKNEPDWYQFGLYYEKDPYMAKYYKKD